MYWPNHPLSEIFPLTVGDEYKRLKEDIKKHGQISPIVLFDDMILDGRTRAKICEELDIVADVTRYFGDDPVSFVLSANLHRRHLTQSQIAMAQAKGKEARKHVRKDQGPGKSGKNGAEPQNCGSAPEIPNSNVSKRSVETARAVLRSGDEELIREVEEGKKTVFKAENEIKEKQKTKNKENKKDKTFLELFEHTFSLLILSMKEANTRNKQLRILERAELAIKKMRQELLD